MRLSALFALLIGLAVAQAHAGESTVDRERMFNHELRLLHSDDTVNLRDAYDGVPLLVVNTASRCGFTGQFAGLEELYQAYRDRGLRVVGFPSNDFRQEVDDEAETAQVCRVNYGVTFDMFAPISVRGDQAHPLFQEIARQSEEPRWNFHKYVVDRDGQVVGAFPSRVTPDSRELRQAIEGVL